MPKELPVSDTERVRFVNTVICNVKSLFLLFQGREVQAIHDPSRSALFMDKVVIAAGVNPQCIVSWSN